MNAGAAKPRQYTLLLLSPCLWLHQQLQGFPLLGR
jgi:hypothetical protein